MQEKTRKLIMYISLAVAVIIAVCAIMFAANQTKFGGLFDVAFWVLICYIGCSLLVWLFYGIISLKDKPKKSCSICWCRCRCCRSFCPSRFRRHYAEGTPTPLQNFRIRSQTHRHCLLCNLYHCHRRFGSDDLFRYFKSF